MGKGPVFLAGLFFPSGPLILGYSVGRATLGTFESSVRMLKIVLGEKMESIKNSFQSFLLLFLAVLLSGCAHVISKDLRRQQIQVQPLERS